MNNLDPCPCCGGEMMMLTERTKLYYAWCTQCGLTSKRYTSEDQVAEAMNKRYVPTCRLAVGPQRGHQPPKITCSECKRKVWASDLNYCPHCGAKVVSDD